MSYPSNPCEDFPAKSGEAISCHRHSTSFCLKFGQIHFATWKNTDWWWRWCPIHVIPGKIPGQKRKSYFLPLSFHLFVSDLSSATPFRLMKKEEKGRRDENWSGFFKHPVLRKKKVFVKENIISVVNSTRLFLVLFLFSPLMVRELWAGLFFSSSRRFH